jgi:hypothetical protein
MQKKINFSKEDLQKCLDFSEQVDTSLYARRNQWDANKRKADSKIGKLGELAAYYSLLEKYPTISYPDFKIYTAKQKSWDYDLKYETFNLHVKTQETLQAAKFGESWIFQSTDKHIFKNHLSNDYVAFVKVNLMQNEAEIKAIVSVDLLHNNKLFAMPMLEKLQYANKLAVYYKDLEKYSDKLWQL